MAFWAAAAPYIISAAGSLAGSLMGRKKVKPPDYSGIINQLNQSGARQRDLISGAYSRLPGMSEKYGTETRGLADTLLKGTEARTGQFAKDYSTAATNLGTNLYDTSKQRIMGQQPELSQNLRESLAASGLRRGGAGLAAQTKLQTSLGEQAGQAAQQISAQELAARQDALRTAFSNNQAAFEKATGMNADTLEKLFASGRADLINEAMELAGIEKDRDATLRAIMGQDVSNRYSQDIARATGKQDLLATLLSQIGQGVGAGTSAWLNKK